MGYRMQKDMKYLILYLYVFDCKISKFNLPNDGYIYQYVSKGLVRI